MDVWFEDWEGAVPVFVLVEAGAALCANRAVHSAKLQRMAGLIMGFYLLRGGKIL